MKNNDVLTAMEIDKWMGIEEITIKLFPKDWFCPEDHYAEVRHHLKQLLRKGVIKKDTHPIGEIFHQTVYLFDGIPF